VKTGGWSVRFQNVNPKTIGDVDLQMLLFHGNSPEIIKARIEKLKEIGLEKETNDFLSKFSFIYDKILKE